MRAIADAIADTVDRPRIVVIGSGHGIGTRILLEYARDAGAVIDIVEPTGITGPPDLVQLLGSVAEVHACTSLEVLPELTADLFVIDGDHNWFTVHGELRTIEHVHRARNARMPVCLLHDVGWPYGRRDMYYDPSRIPADARQPFVDRGMVPGHAELSTHDGFNPRHFNATREGGERNGVLTAAEDFVAESELDWKLHVVPGFHGLGVLYDASSLDPSTRVRLEEILELTEHARALLEAVEHERLLLATELSNLYGRLGGRPGPRAAYLVRAAKRLIGR